MKNSTKSIVFILFSLFFYLNSNAQLVSGMTYQAVVRNSSNELVANTEVGVKISILQGSESGTIVFSESHTTTTNANGLATFIIGEGKAIISNFFAINWLGGLHFIKTETDPKGGTNYTISNTSQLNTVPYAQFAENALYATSSGDSWKKTGNVIDQTTDFIGSTNTADVIFKRSNIKAGRIADTNTSLGSRALLLGDNTSSNTAFGSSSLRNLTTGFGNLAVGYLSLQNSNGNLNTAIGRESLINSTGDQNTAIGWKSLENLTTGGGNIGIGKIVDVPSPTTNNQLSIGNVIYGTNMGNTATGTIGIGVPVPTEKLEVAGKTKTTNLQVTAGAGANKVLTSDLAGNATWQTPSNLNTGLEARITSIQLIPNDLPTKLVFSTESADDANAHSTTTGNWTIPSTGFYHIYATLGFRNFVAPGSYIKMIVYKNGNEFRKNTSVVGYTSFLENFDIAVDTKLNQNDEISIYVHQTSGLELEVGASPGSVYFSGFKVY